MGSSRRLMFDLNELPSEERDENSVVPTLNHDQPPEYSEETESKHTYEYALSGSVFQPFVQSIEMQEIEWDKKEDCLCAEVASSSVISSCVEDIAGRHNAPVDRAAVRADCSNIDGSSDTRSCVSVENKKNLHIMGKRPDEETVSCIVKSNVIFDGDYGLTDIGDASRDSTAHGPSNSVKNFQQGLKGSVQPAVTKGGQSSYAIKSTSNPTMKPKVDEHKEAMLGKKRARQTVLINVEAAKQAGSSKAFTPRRQSSFPSPLVTRTVKDHSHSISSNEQSADRQGQHLSSDQKKSEMVGPEAFNVPDVAHGNADLNGDVESIHQRSLKKMGDDERPTDRLSVPRQGSSKQPADSGQIKKARDQALRPTGQSTTDQKTGSIKQLFSNVIHHQDTSVERFTREVTNEKFWHHPEDTELQNVPESFGSPEEYVKVFEPLLFEECRAQLHSTFEELTEAASRDANIMVRVKSVEQRERGWYDVLVLSMHESKWTFKEGEVAVLSSRHDSVIQSGRSSRRSNTSNEGFEGETYGRLVGTVRRHFPIDRRELIGASIHFHIGDSSSANSKDDENHILRKLLVANVWYLTTLGSVATAQWEYVALHGFRRLNSQMQKAILQPSPDQFPKYEEQPPAMPDCFTQGFVHHIHRTFNGPQLAAIKWAAMHTASGTTNGSSKRQEPWPFTLVQGPPGTGKTHTVWGMLNVIHLVQYQHYYTALLKNVAPESYKQVSGDGGSVKNATPGSIDEVLQSMDQSLYRTLPKLCPKPRMLVCAPSNAATDELLARVLDRGFIDGEMKVYRPDVARVGVDSQSRAAQAVSVERRAELLLMKSRNEVIGWLHQLKGREKQLSQEISVLQRELNVAAAASRSQGSVSVDPDVLVARDQSRDLLLQSLAAAVESRDKVLVEMSRLLILESQFHPGSNFNKEDARANLEASFADEAEIVFTTVSSSGRRIFTKLAQGFDMVVIDEAAQAGEVAVLPPLSLGAARCVLVGDPQQLPATVISKAAGTLRYNRSLFERFQQAGCPTIMLSVQYRMHPHIREFPSRYFYQGRLTDSASVTNLPDEMYYMDPLLKPYAFYDVMHGRESHLHGSASYQNVTEAEFALRLYEHLRKFVKYNNCRKRVSVGIITPYKLQLKCLRQVFRDVMSSEEGHDIYINTVDAFQGQERDVIIMSCVRASTQGVGFVADIRRMNVALTRAKRALWVVGNANALARCGDWAALIADAKERRCFMDLDCIPKDFFHRRPS